MYFFFYLVSLQKICVSQTKHLPELVYIHDNSWKWGFQLNIRKDIPIVTS